MPELIYGTKASKLLRNIAVAALRQCLEVRAAIAYASDDKIGFFENRADAGKFVTFYGRYDHSVHVAPSLLKRFLARGEDVACDNIAAWRIYDNESRPHSALDSATPAEFARNCRLEPELAIPGSRKFLLLNGTESGAGSRPAIALRHPESDRGAAPSQAPLDTSSCFW